jgi:hypothetical protein
MKISPHPKIEPRLTLMSGGEAPSPNMVSQLNNLENSNIEQLWAVDQQLSKILVVVVSYVWFTTPMAFCVLSTLINN